MTICRHNKHEIIIIYQLMTQYQQQNPHQRAPAAAAEFPVTAQALSLTVYKLATISEIGSIKNSTSIRSRSNNTSINIRNSTIMISSSSSSGGVAQ